MCRPYEAGCGADGDSGAVRGGEISGALGGGMVTQYAAAKTNARPAKLTVRDRDGARE
jgi:hypothetical protein